jgi:cytoskeleton-associated protein 5
MLGEITSVLKKAMADTNLSVKMLALGIISKIAAGMGQPFDKHAKILTAPIASVCADQKAGTRAAALATLTAISEAIGGLDAMYTGIATSLETTNPALRASVLGWLAERLQAEAPLPGADLAPLAGPTLSCLEDRNGDVRKAAGAVLPFVVASAGYEYVMDQTSNLKPASRATIVPLIEKARGSIATAPAATKSTSAPVVVAKVKTAAPVRSTTPGSPAPAAPAARTIAAPVRSMAMKALGTAPAIRPSSSHFDDRAMGIPKTRVGLGLTRPTTSSSHAASVPPPTRSNFRQAPFITSSPEPRLARLKKDSVRWILDSSPKNDLAEYLAAQMEPHTSPELYSLLFSKDHRAEEDFMAAMSTISDFYALDAPAVYELSEDEIRGLQMGNVDLALKYSALKLMGNNTQLNNRCLEVLSNVVDCLTRCDERFADAEARLFVPALITKVRFIL